MKDYTVEALINFNDIEDNTNRAKGTIFKCTKERYEFLKEQKAVTLLGIDEIKKEIKEEVEEKPKRKRTKKTIENDK